MSIFVIGWSEPSTPNLPRIRMIKDIIMRILSADPHLQLLTSRRRAELKWGFQGTIPWNRVSTYTTR